MDVYSGNQNCNLGDKNWGRTSNCVQKKTKRGQNYIKKKKSYKYSSHLGPLCKTGTIIRLIGIGWLLCKWGIEAYQNRLAPFEVGGELSWWGEH